MEPILEERERGGASEAPAPTSPSSRLLIRLPRPWRSALINSTIGTFAHAACEGSPLSRKHACEALPARNASGRAQPVQPGPAACESSLPLADQSHRAAPRLEGTARPSIWGPPRGAKQHGADEGPNQVQSLCCEERHVSDYTDYSVEQQFNVVLFHIRIFKSI